METDDMPNMVAIAKSIERIAATMLRWQEEDRQWIAEIDERVGHLRKVVADHEERLTA